jgi:hypothetical protein
MTVQTYGVALALVGAAVALIMGTGRPRLLFLRAAMAAALFLAAMAVMLPHGVPAPAKAEVVPDTWLLGELGVSDDEEPPPPAREVKPPPVLEPPLPPPPLADKERKPRGLPVKQQATSAPPPPIKNEPAKPSNPLPATAQTHPAKARWSGIDAAAYKKIVEDFWKRLDGRGAKRGKYSVSLKWNNTDDLDVRADVCDAEGNVLETIDFSHKTSACGGELDVDANLTDTTSTPVENIVWAKAGSKPAGALLKVYVRNYKLREGRTAPTRFTLLIHEGTKKERIINNETNEEDWGEPVATVSIR